MASKDNTVQLDPSHQSAPPRGWWECGYLVKLNIGIVCLTFLSSTNGYDSSLLNGLQALPGWLEFMEHSSSVWLGFINALYWIGAATITLAAATVANRFGRKKGIWLGYICLILGTILQTAAPNVACFIVARLFTGAAMGWMNNSTPVLIAEVAYPSHRGIASALYMTSYYIGSIVAAWVTFGTRTWDSSWAWRFPSILQFLMPTLALPALFLEARQTLITHHAGGDATLPWIDNELRSIQHAIAVEFEAEKHSTYSELIRTPGHRHRLFITITLGFYDQWAGNGPLSYYLALVLKAIGVTKTRDQLLISACLQVWNLPWALAAALSVNRMGRRKLFLLSAGIMLVSYIIMTGLSGSFATTANFRDGDRYGAVYLCLFCWTPLLTAYPCEIWPFRLRSRGLMVTWMSCIIAVIFNTFVNPIAMDAIGWKYYIVYLVLLIFWCLITYLWYPETRGLSLEDVAVRVERFSKELQNAISY
ncbi:general substrate transporter [Aspergillus karnatakaensis]|uniref:general substrate transporter n=1 Tax=Aspergillus karnatakaensis TaxID=1810916 RepID=UPI003CCCEE66